MDPFTVVEYIKASVEILMNMKMDEQQTQGALKIKKVNKGDDDVISVQSSARLLTNNLDLENAYET